MILDILNKVFIILFMLSSLNVFRHGYYFLQAWFKSENEEPVRYVISPRALFFLGISLAYILTGIFSGITI